MIFENKKHLLLVILFVLIFSSCSKYRENKHELVINDLIQNYEKPKIDFDLYDIDCEKIDDLLTEIYKNDQDVRNNGVGNMEDVDDKNLQIFTSIVLKCGFPNKQQIKSKESEIAIFLVIQHSSPEWIAYYYKQFISAVESGVLNKNFLPFIQDRFLSYNNKPQIYGTQIKDEHLYMLSDPYGVNKRRKKMGLGEIESYLESFGLDFETEIKRFQNNSTFN
ncbi:hypothetical protein MK851_12095 [Tenacibaculum sp. 1B UA]|uniref:DUF6624 domain-containing protein n=1 Tax=Tenacibaculum sp. 1B UA TaxID=2922252 RepID=UPI002A239E9A|nr:DUF6624 domain-containing protein [Tenacibaculum sp. 1B UA]MDX8554361.1 hypothetical protein [Tenacibaculum sp. 1B UA]